MLKQHPVHALLTPPAGQQPPASAFQRARLSLAQGIPHPLSFPGLDLSVTLIAPSARVRYWLQQAGDAVAASSADQHAPYPQAARGDDPRAALAPALVFTRATRLLCVLPLRLHTRSLLPRTGLIAGAALEIEILGFTLASQALRGPAGGASHVELAWRRIDTGKHVFTAPTLRSSLRQRLVATTGLGDAQKRRQIDAAPQTDSSSAPSTDGRLGGLQWSLTHD